MVNENMVTTRSLYKMLLALFLLLSALPAQAEAPQDTHYIARYDFSWNGLPLAAAELSVDEDKRSYSLHLVVATKGVVNIFTRHRSDTTVKGVRDGNTYRPRLYESHYWTKDKPRHLKLAFNAHGAITEEIVEPPENRKERPDVPHAQKDYAIDPLSILRAMPGGEQQPKVFDAKHLWQGIADPIVTPEPTVISGRHVTGYILSRKPIAGMTDKETRDFAKGEPPLYYYVTADDRHVPVYMKMTVYLGRLAGSLTKECQTWDECKIN